MLPARIILRLKKYGEFVTFDAGLFRFTHSQHKYTVKSAPILKKNLNKNKLNNINNTNRSIVCACERITRMQLFFEFLISMTKLCDKMGKKDWNGKRHGFYYNFFYTHPL